MRFLFLTVCSLFLTSPVFAQTNEQPNRKALPVADPEFKGKIGETFRDSQPSFPLPLKAPAGSPNVLLILLDDVGFGMCSTFGGPVHTPHLDQLANNGLKLEPDTPNRFHLVNPPQPVVNSKRF